MSELGDPKSVKKIVKSKSRGVTRSYLKALRCRKCTWVWVPRRWDHLPKKCPNCMAPKWNKPFSMDATWKAYGLPPGTLVRGRSVQHNVKDGVLTMHDSSKVNIKTLFKALNLAKEEYNFKRYIKVKHIVLGGVGFAGWYAEWEEWKKGVETLVHREWDTLLDAYLELNAVVKCCDEPKDEIPNFEEAPF